MATIIYSLLLLLLFSVYKILRVNYNHILFSNSIPRSIAIIQPIIFCFFTCLSRLFFSSRILKITKDEAPNLMIYGAGTAGSQLQELIQKNDMYRVVAFIDDNISKQKKLISGITDAHPIIGGIAPAAPPMTILSGVILFSQKV